MIEFVSRMYDMRMKAMRMKGVGTHMKRALIRVLPTNRSTPVCSRSLSPVPPPLTFFHPSLSPSSAHLPPIFRRFAANHGIQRQVGGGTPTASANPLHPTHHTAVSTATDTSACCTASGVPDVPRSVTVAGPGASMQSLQNVLSPGGLQQGGQGGIPGMDLVIQQAGQLRETLLQVRGGPAFLLCHSHHSQCSVILAHTAK